MDNKKHTTIRICLCLLTCILAVLSFTTLLDIQAEILTERSLTRSLVAFGIARSLNGIISVVQGTEFAIQPGGLGIVVTPGQVLDPINDLIERFSWVMLVASTSLGIQKILLSMAGWHYFTMGVSIALLLLAVQLWRTRRSSGQQRVYQLILLLLVVRFGIALIAVGGELVFTTFLESRYESASIELENTTAKLKQLSVVEENENHSLGSLMNQDPNSNASKWKSLDVNQWMTGIKAFVSEILQNLDPTQRIEHYKAVAETTSKSAIDLVVVFVFQTIIFPLGFLTLLISGTRSYLRL